MDPILLKTILELDEYTRTELFRLNKELERLFKQHMRGEEVADKEGFYKEAFKAIALWGGAFTAGWVAYNVLAAKRSIDTDNERLKIQFRPYATNQKVYKFLDNERDRTAAFVGNTLLGRKFNGKGPTNEQRFKTIVDGAQRTVRNIVEVGIKDGTPSWEIAKQIESYVKPEYKDGKRVAPWTIARRELGRPVSYIPKGMPAGSVEYNAMRIARTEMAKTYQQAPYLAHKDKWYYNGVKWVLSRSHPKEDICDRYATHDEGLGIGIWKKCPEIPHPHDMCHTEVQTVPPEEMIRMFKMLNW